MAVNVNKPTTQGGKAPEVKAVTSAPPKPPEQVRIELVGFGRLNVGRAVYEKGTVYTCTPEQADAFLEFEVDGVRPFRKWKPKAKQQVEQEDAPRTRAVPQAAKPVTPSQEDPSNDNAPGRVDVTSPEEEAELYGKADTPEGKDNTVAL